MQSFERQTQNSQEKKITQLEKIQVDYVVGLKKALNEVRVRIGENLQKTDFKSLATFIPMLLLIS